MNRLSFGDVRSRQAQRQFGLRQLTWPHVEKDGVLCLLPSSAEIDYREPVAVCATILNDAYELVAKLARGEIVHDFRAEFVTYWGWDVTRWEIPLWSLLRPEPPSRPFYYWPGQEFFLLGESEAELIRWLKNFNRRFDPEHAVFKRGALLWLPQVLTPDQYPRNASDVMSIARSIHESRLLTSVYDEDTSHLLAVLCGNSPNGPSFAATIVSRGETTGQPGVDRSNRLTHGFRPGRTPQKVLQARLFGSAPVARGKVERADASWVHGRDGDERFRILREARVAFFGCGSLGGHLSTKLAEAGVGRQRLYDQGRFEWPNVGRHPLGAGHVDANKAEALANRLKQDYPHADEISGFAWSCEKALESHAAELAQCDLIIAAMGNWAAEGALNAWHQSDRRNRPPIIYTWIEPHAAAGHAVVIASRGGCLQCGFSSNGKPNLSVTTWPRITTQQEPGCGATFQPYGPVELSHITALAADIAIDCLLGSIHTSTHRVWCGRRSLVLAAGGEWTDDWSQIAGSRTWGGFLEERQWNKAAQCLECVLRAA